MSQLQSPVPPPPDHATVGRIWMGAPISGSITTPVSKDVREAASLGKQAAHVMLYIYTYCCILLSITLLYYIAMLGGRFSSRKKKKICSFSHCIKEGTGTER